MSIALSVSDKGSHLNCGTLSCSRQEKLVNTPFFLFCCVYIILLAFFFGKRGILRHVFVTDYPSMSCHSWVIVFFTL